jgi:uncharacterized protein
MQIASHWETIRKVLNESRSSLHCAAATVNKDGSPHVTPVGSLFLRDDKTGFYFDEHFVTLTKNLEHDPRVCILVVNCNPLFWINSLKAGKFATPPAMRLTGSVGKKREATEEELSAWQNYVKFAAGTKGHDLIWKDMAMVRDIYFDSLEPVLMGEMTQGLWE